MHYFFCLESQTSKVAVPLSPGEVLRDETHDEFSLPVIATDQLSSREPPQQHDPTSPMTEGKPVPQPMPSIKKPPVGLYAKLKARTSKVISPSDNLPCKDEKSEGSQLINSCPPPQMAAKLTTSSVPAQKQEIKSYLEETSKAVIRDKESSKTQLTKSNVIQKSELSNQATVSKKDCKEGGYEAKSDVKQAFGKHPGTTLQYVSEKEKDEGAQLVTEISRETSNVVTQNSLPISKKIETSADPNASKQSEQNTYSPDGIIVFPDEQKKQRSYSVNSGFRNQPKQQWKRTTNAAPAGFNYSRNRSVSKPEEKVNITSPETESKTFKSHSNESSPRGETKIESPRERIIRNIEEFGTPLGNEPQTSDGIASVSPPPSSNVTSKPFNIRNIEHNDVVSSAQGSSTTSKPLTTRHNEHGSITGASSELQSSNIPAKPRTVIPFQKEIYFESPNISLFSKPSTQNTDILGNKPPAPPPTVKPKPQRSKSIEQKSPVATDDNGKSPAFTDVLGRQTDNNSSNINTSKTDKAVSNDSTFMRPVKEELGIRTIVNMKTMGKLKLGCAQDNIRNTELRSSQQDAKKLPPKILPKSRHLSVDNNEEINVKPSQLFGVSQTLPRDFKPSSRKYGPVT